jgi:hypothetical protein
MVEGWAVALIVTGAFTVIGWLVARLTTQNEVIRTQRETIETQRRNIDQLEITGKLQDKMLSALPHPRAPGGARR